MPCLKRHSRASPHVRSARYEEDGASSRSSDTHTRLSDTHAAKELNKDAALEGCRKRELAAQLSMSESAGARQQGQAVKHQRRQAADTALTYFAAATGGESDRNYYYYYY